MSSVRGESFRPFRDRIGRNKTPLWSGRQIKVLSWKPYSRFKRDKVVRVGRGWGLGSSRCDTHTTRVGSVGWLHISNCHYFVIQNDVSLLKVKQVVSTSRCNCCTLTATLGANMGTLIPSSILASPVADSKLKQPFYRPVMEHLPIIAVHGETSIS